MLAIEHGATPRQELEAVNTMRRAFGLPAIAGYRRADGRVVVGWEPEAQPLWVIEGGADGIFYRDLREPHTILDESSVTLATTDKQLFVTMRTVLPANYLRVGKVIKLTSFGKLTTDGTAGNYIFKMYYGTADATGASVAGATVAGTVSQTNISYMAEGYLESRAIDTAAGGTTGVIRMWGRWMPAVAVLASTLQPYLFPASAPADSSVDTSLGTNAPNFQLQRSGAGVWTATTTNLLFEALN